jgi:hypothetical protein
MSFVFLSARIAIRFPLLRLRILLDVHSIKYQQFQIQKSNHAKQFRKSVYQHPERRSDIGSMERLRLICQTEVEGLRILGRFR